MLVFDNHIFLIRYTLRITKMFIWKSLRGVLARNFDFWPRATFKGLLLLLLLLFLVLVLAWKHEWKMFQIEQKLCKERKKLLLWHIMALNCRVWFVWPYVALYGLMWSWCCFSRPWLYVVWSELLRPCLTLLFLFFLEWIHEWKRFQIEQK